MKSTQRKVPPKPSIKPNPEISYDARIRAAIRSVPAGKVATYGSIARAAGLPQAPRRVAMVLHRAIGLPWHRILGAGGEIKLRGEPALEQRFRLESEGVTFRGRKVNLKLHEFQFPSSRRVKAR